MPERIVIRGARQNNLKNLSLELPLNELVVVTGVSGSGKSSLVFDTLYAEGQRRYVETFSPYARQFLDRMDKPQVDRIEGIPPAIAIDQTNPVRTSRSTVGTMTELADYLKLLYARAAELYCRRCGRKVRRDTAETIYTAMAERGASSGDPRLVITFPVTVPANFSEAEVIRLLEGQGYARIHARRGPVLEVVQDRLRMGNAERARVIEALEAALRVGQGRVNVHVVADGPVTSAAATAGEPHASADTWRFSTDLHCPDCDLHYRDPTPSFFSFNSPLGACEKCRGFGRVIGLDDGLVVPDATKTLRAGAIRPWQSASFSECQDDLVKYAKKRSVPLDVPWRELDDAQRRWALEGEPEWESWGRSWPGVWYGVRRFFAWLETKSYKMHIRVLLSKYRAYTPCEICGGARLKPDALLWRLGTREDSERTLEPRLRFRPRGVELDDASFARLPGLTVHDLMLLPVDRARDFLAHVHLPSPLDNATDLLLAEISARFRYLSEVGLGYLTLDRQSRTLSGGEVQRINLTTALGTSLVNTLFVLDEPSIGLHPRDMGRVIGVMERLRDAGNSLVVVEHDPQIMLAADHVLDIGPGPGEHGGEIVFFGTPAELMRSTRSLTGDYLAGRKRADRSAPTTVPIDGPRIELAGVSEHNLQDIDLAIPLERLVCITGVSGSGKSTLVQDVLHPALLRAKGKPTETPGAHRDLRGHELIEDVVLVDQTPIGRTTRSNPASYVGAFDAIRKRFAASPLAKERGYTTGTFSFNAGTGRCPTCGGNGFEHVEMQFLSDVYLRCPDCNGTRYRADVLDVTLEGKSIADVLDLTVGEARVFFGAESDIDAALQPLAEVGLDYLKLGQPVPTLSGGEAQRLKLAGFLSAAGRSPAHTRGNARVGRGKLFLFDEPTTGLHFDDVARLLRAFRKLLAAGHTLVVIEHNLDVVRAADWIVDLGPEGGDQGGRVVVAGTVAEVMACEASHTGAALRSYEAAPGAAARSGSDIREAPPRTVLAQRSNAICVHNAREHNLQNIDVDIPRERFTVITGVSGSGKSTLAFDILFAEGQRRYLESLNAYARQFVQPASRPDVDAIFGIPPTVAIEQRASRGGRKSTVATLTEVYHFLRLLYVKIGTQYCPDHGAPIAPQSEEAIAATLLRCAGRQITLLAPLVVARKGYYTDLAKWAARKGFAELRVDGAMLPTARWPRLDRFKEHSIELPVATLVVSAGAESALRDGLARALEFGKGVVQVLASPRPVPGKTKSKVESDPAFVLSTKRACPVCSRSFAELDPRLFSFNSKHGWCGTCFGTGLKLRGFDAEQSGEEIWWNEWYEDDAQACPACEGQRLNPEALAVRFRDESIADLARLSVSDARRFFAELDLHGREAAIARDIVAELSSRLAFLDDVGLGYLTLDRSAPTLAGGEAQRIRLAAQLGSNLRGVCYILDEPTIGLHPRDNRVLLDTLAKLRAKGNTLVVVEHDEETIRGADHVIDLGPGAGSRGGRVVAEGSAAELEASPDSITGRFLAHPLLHPLVAPRITTERSPAIVVAGARRHNLRNVRARIPLERLTVITGVSGSGKSTLARDVLYANMGELVGRGRRRKPVELLGCTELSGWEAFERVLEVDQTPIGRTPRSCPATYVGFWDSIRRLYAETNEARMRGFTASRFSFNTAGGRCAECEGQGLKTIEMSFLPDVKVVCEACNGARFNSETLAATWRGKAIGEVLAMNVDEAVEFFAAHRRIHHALALLQDVGLGYLTLGQQSPTLSGGEAQRIKLVTELAKSGATKSRVRLGVQGARGGSTLYVLDEPTVGLHMADVEKLIRVLHRLVDAGNTVVVIEHNLDVIADADWIVDLGPEGGAGGGRVVAQGSVDAITTRPAGSHTATLLAEFLQTRRRPQTADQVA
jgi:excinuclease ABC subunit A